jgi:membrane protease YdiL (CAAX protease family)
VTATSGVAYAEYFATSSNAWRTAVAGLAAGSLVLIVFLVWARWDFVWRDPERLLMPTILKVVVALHVPGVVWSFATRDWAAGNGRPRARAAGGRRRGVRRGDDVSRDHPALVAHEPPPRVHRGVGLELWFGLFHVTNIVNGSPATGVVLQVVNASLAGAVLYCLRRYAGALVVGMVVHGLWDIGVFLPVNEDLSLVSGAGPLVGGVVAGAIALVVLRRDRDIAVTREGIVPLADGTSTAQAGTA